MSQGKGVSLTTGKKLLATIPKDTLFTVSTGEYSDYTIIGVFRAKVDIDPNKMLDDWRMDRKEHYSGKFEEVRYYLDGEEFLAFISNVIEPIKSMEWHIEDYGREDEMWVEDADGTELWKSE